MKNNKATSLIAALSLLLPVGALAQAGSGTKSGSAGSSSTSSGTTGTQDSSSTSRQYPSTGTTGTTGSSSSSQYPTTGSSTQSSGTSQYPSTTGQQSSVSGQLSSSYHQEFKRIKEDKLKEKKMTAENIIGKKVVDRDGQTIGKVKDIGLESALQDFSAVSSGQYSSSSGVSSSATTTSSGSVGAGAMTGRSSMGSMSQSMGINLYVELDDSVGIQGDYLASIPVSSVTFDSTKGEMKLQIARSELTSKLKQSDSSSN